VAYRCLSTGFVLARCVAYVWFLLVVDLIFMAVVSRWGRRKLWLVCGMLNGCFTRRLCVTILYGV